MTENTLDIQTDKNYDIDNDIANKLGYILLKKGIIDSKTLVKAVVARRNENLHTNGNGKPKRNLAQILVQDFKYDHDSIYREVANLYAFRTFEIDLDEDNSEQIEKIKKLINKFDDTLKRQMVTHRVIPIKYDEKIPDKI